MTSVSTDGQVFAPMCWLGMALEISALDFLAMTLIERALGRPFSRAVVPHVDDLGASHGANSAFLDLAARGLVTCGSVMVPGPWFRRSRMRRRPIHPWTSACTSP